MFCRAGWFLWGLERRRRLVITCICTSRINMYRTGSFFTIQKVRSFISPCKSYWMLQMLFWLFILLWMEYGRVLEGVPSNGFVGSRFEYVSLPSVLKKRGSDPFEFIYQNEMSYVRIPSASALRGIGTLLQCQWWDLCRYLVPTWGTVLVPVLFNLKSFEISLSAWIPDVWIFLSARYFSKTCFETFRPVN